MDSCGDNIGNHVDNILCVEDYQPLSGKKETETDDETPAAGKKVV